MILIRGAYARFDFHMRGAFSETPGKAMRTVLALAVALPLIASVARADSVSFSQVTVTISGTVNTPPSVSPTDGDAAINGLNPGDKFSVTLKYDGGASTAISGGTSWLLSDASLSTTYFPGGIADHYSALSSAAGDFLQIGITSTGMTFRDCSPGGASCPALPDFALSFLFSGGGLDTGLGTSLGALTAEFAGLTLNDFDLQHNFADFSQTEVQCSLVSTSSNCAATITVTGGQVPEPGTLALLGSGVAAAWLRKRLKP